jgi:hypothetical protein
MKSKALIAMAVAGAFASAGAFADQSSGYMYSGYNNSVNETSIGMTTVTSLDNYTGGYKGWGPMANPHLAASVSETNGLEATDKEREHKQHLAEVNAAREQVWVANAPLRAEYENIGATRSEGRGFGRFFGR